MENFYSITITPNTEELLLRRVKDDYRVRYAHHVLFSEKGIREDIASTPVNGENVTLRTAVPEDLFVYLKIPDTEGIKSYIETNVSNIARLKSGKELQNLKRVWLLCYDIPEEDAENDKILPTTTIYIDPDASDINKIVKGRKVILGAFLILEYRNQAQTRIEWTFVSPEDFTNSDERNEVLKEEEVKNLERVFALRFDKKK
jgi:hypothetical protein